uniref:WRKY domain-containing protein n=1 Tax=Kalanchoe fedtschenkoi TaxID=63787 RepID=A0A7N0U114_KALFE
MIMDDNWGLHAVVNGCTQQAQQWNNAVDIQEELLFHMGQNHHQLPDLPFDLISSPMSFDLHELEDIYKLPFGDGLASGVMLASGSNPKLAVDMQQHHQQYEVFGGSSSSAYHLPGDNGTAFIAAAAASNRAKRKNQQKRVVQHVTANGLSTDLWAWRKYGQKPIKGSFYPRSYYRCSSSKGCAARKQVEQSSLDPNIFTITYTADHNHPHPTRRSSLSGVSKNKKASSAPPNKKPTPPPPPPTSSLPLKDSSSSNSPTMLNMSAPTTPLMVENTSREDGIKEECSTVAVEDGSMMDLGCLGFEEEIGEMGFDGYQSWFPHWLDGRSTC